MPLWLDQAPLIHGVFVAACMAYGAQDHYRIGKHSERRRP
jgi:hypothetical protein